MEAQQTPDSLYPYTERNGVGVAADVEAVLADPEYPLTDPEREQMRALGIALFEGKFDGLEAQTATRHAVDGDESRPATLKEIHQTSVAGSEHTFYVRYFTTEAGRADASRIAPDDDSSDPSTIVQKLLDTDYIQEQLTAKQRKEIATRGLNWRREELAKSLGDPDAIEAYQDEETVTVNYTPEKLLAKLEDLQAYRTFYRTIHRRFKEETDVPDHIRTVRQTLIDLHMARVNSLLADLIPHAANLARQLDASEPSEQTNRLSEQLAAVVPTVVRAFRTEDADREAHVDAYLDGYARRLDLVRNGAAWQPGSRNASPLSPELSDLADELSASTARELPEPELSAEDIALLDQTRWQAPQVQQFSESVLDSWDMLSEHTATWDEVDDRSGWAPDGKWQVVVHPKRKSLSINGTKGVVIVPEDFDRGLLDESPAGALPVTAHELTHVWQTEHDKRLAEQLPLAEIKGRRYVTMREMGGIEQERAIQAKVGRTRGVNLHYLRALEAKQAGANKLAVATTFYESVKAGRELDAKEDAAARNLAADRTLRLYRNSGHNSQPLDYIEQELILRGLGDISPTHKTAVIIAGGSFSLRDSAALRRADLLELPREIEVNPAEDVWRIFMRDMMPAIKAAAGRA